MIDFIEVNVMGYMFNDIDIYSVSWGLIDDGKMVDGFCNMIMRVIVKGVNEVLIIIFKIIYCLKLNCVLRKFLLIKMF